MTTRIVPQTTDIAHFPDDVRPTFDIPLAAIDNSLGRALTNRDPIYVSQGARGILTYSTSSPAPGVGELLAETDWLAGDGTTGHFVGWYGIDEHSPDGMVRLTLLSNVRCTVYSWCSGHDAIGLAQNEPERFHNADDTALADFSGFDERGRVVHAVGSRVKDNGLDRYSLHIDVDLCLGKKGLQDLAVTLLTLSARVEREADSMAADR
ncbi:hypothetical protein NB037_03210 [Rathayibacter sp. ZW T2_19]|uniref:Uncharacterized protein n=1 Tax=Rathayibacter rubneri TaxID=2950106 RepID=A0A9X2DUF3_9MICO|nr:hypothetical protein [Rathayibacter rubneri]MCM6761417.1 hypothetical protein [Rathayibacter rubneri]